MKISTFLAALVATPIMAVAFSPNAHAGDGTITFKGMIKSVTCDITGGDNTDGSKGDITVNLRDTNITALPRGSRTSPTAFSLNIGGTGGSCTDGKIAKVVFEQLESPLINPVTGNLKNSTGAGRATNVEISLSNDKGQVINLATNENSTEAEIDGGAATLNYTAYYQADANNDVTAGTVDTNVIYSMDYN
ncbi:MULTISPECIES: fimbrial protein [Dyella]|uniref:Type 1 fimbrial protein n=2 Tax=Dyella TaxID=231454 RepID=A0A4R0YHJ2_9GAMM|nr:MULTISPECIES: fimbrial protein [Dyella]TBR37031.1 type 1 fimbrial protein [Dyella terrae]TCI07880.1 type 1 fimbrial protein [Dyella soli]